MARYKVSDPREMLLVMDFINRAKEQNAEIVVDYYSPNRSGRQNRYLYFCLSYFAHCYGCTLIECKEIYFKRYACGDIFQVLIDDKNGNRVDYYRSTADLSKEEMSMAIRNFRAYASIHGIEIPDATDDVSIRWCEQQMQRTKHYR